MMCVCVVSCSSCIERLFITPSALSKTCSRLLLREGWFRAIYLTLRLKPGSLVHGGPPCGSFVWINAHTSGRRTWRPFGFASLRPYVRQANVNLVY